MDNFRGEALGTHCNGYVVPDAFCRFRATQCGDFSSSGSVITFGRVFAGVYSCESGGLVVAWVKPSIQTTHMDKIFTLVEVLLVNVAFFILTAQLSVLIRYCQLSVR